MLHNFDFKYKNIRTNFARLLWSFHIINNFWKKKEIIYFIYHEHNRFIEKPSGVYGCHLHQTEMRQRSRARSYMSRKTSDIAITDENSALTDEIHSKP